MTRTYLWIVGALRVLGSIFFREVVVTGEDNLPAAGGGVLVAWHPNGLLDPALILTSCPGQVVFGARDGLFRWPGLGTMMRALGTVPIYRRKDARAGGSDDERREANRKSLDALADAVAGGSFAVLFPEGVSHDQPYVMELKTGAASLFVRALERTPEGDPEPVIVPVGLHYADKHLLGSRVLVSYHPPLEIPTECREGLGERSSEERRAGYRQLTERIEEALVDVVRPTETWVLHRLMQRARKLIRAERGFRAGVRLGRPGIAERVMGFARLWVGYQQRLASHPEQTRAVTGRVAGYDRTLRALGVEDHEIDPEARLGSRWLVFKLALQVLAVYLLLPPIVLLGLIVNLPVALVIAGLAKAMAKKAKDEASVKLLVGVLAFPLAWVTAGALVAWGVVNFSTGVAWVDEEPLWAGVLTVLFSAAGGAFALHYGRLARETARALRVRFTRWRRSDLITDLRNERAEIFDALMVMAEGLELPGQVSDEGRVSSRGVGHPAR